MNDSRYIRPEWHFPDDGYIRFLDEPASAEGMRSPVRCTKCSTVYDLASGLPGHQRYDDCDAWLCPGCSVTVSSRRGMADHHYVELDADGYPRTMR